MKATLSLCLGACVAALAPHLRDTQEETAGPDPGIPSSEELVRRMHAAIGDPDLRALRRDARAARRAAAVGSADWVGATYVLAFCQHALWTPLDLVVLREDTLAALQREVHAPLDAAAEAPLATIERWCVLALRALDRDAEARELLRALDHDGFEPVPLEVDQAIALHFGGRPEAALELLRAARERRRGTLEGLFVDVALGMADAFRYDGEYSDDPLARARFATALRAHEAVLERIAERLGENAEPSGALAIIADRPDELGGALAFAYHDTRRPEMPPLVVLFTETLVREEDDVVQVLVHEYAHLATSRRLGVLEQRLPAWVREGVAFDVAGELDAVVEHLVTGAALADLAGFLASDAWVDALVERAFRPGTRSRTGRLEDALPYLLLREELGDAAPRALVDSLAETRDLDTTLRRLVGSGLDAYLERAEEHARHRLRESGERSERTFVALRWAMGLNPAAAVPVLTGALRDARTRSEAVLLRRARGRAYAALGRFGEAERDFRAIVQGPFPRNVRFQSTRVDLARALFELGRDEEASELLRRVLAYAADESVREYAAEVLDEESDDGGEPSGSLREEDADRARRREPRRTAGGVAVDGLQDPRRAR